MGLSHSPRIVTDGLVFAYDMGNPQKSWRGKPTTNYILSLDNPTLEYARGEFGQYFNFASIFETYGLVPYSLSFEAKANIPGNVVVYMQNGSYTKYSFVSQNITVSTEWQRFKLENLTPAGPTAGWQANTPADNRAMLATYTVYGSGRNPILKNIQLELGSFSTPFTASTRSNTQAILDLTNNNTVTATSLTYASDGTFSFNGSSNWIELPTSSVFDSQNITMESWNKPTTTSQSGFLFEKGQVNTQYSNFYNSDGIFYFRTIGLSPADLTFTTSTHITAGQWNHIVCTVGAGVKTVYINGVQRYQQTGVTGTMPTGQTNQYVGKYGNAGNNYPFSGQISISKVYNRALTAIEIQQNFNALRGRYGI